MKKALPRILKRPRAGFLQAFVRYPLHDGRPWVKIAVWDYLESRAALLFALAEEPGTSCGPLYLKEDYLGISTRNTDWANEGEWNDFTLEGSQENSLGLIGEFDRIVGGTLSTQTPKTCCVIFRPNGGGVGIGSKTVTVGQTYGELPMSIRNGYSFAGWYTSSSGGTRVTASTTVTQTQDHTLYARWTSVVNPYNLGEETYSFENYGDSDSAGGHCFGMSITSAEYYNNLLDIGRIGGNSDTPLYSFQATQTVKKPICYYQRIQGSYAARATVAGGSFYLKHRNNIASDWQEVVAYVRDHGYDNTGLFQIGFRKDKEGGHAINFLRYENVNGQDRIYAYDNNFPTQETYFYRDSSGNVRQAPVQTFSGAIDCIALRDCRKYFKSVGDFDFTHVLYMAENAASVEGDYPHVRLDVYLKDDAGTVYNIEMQVEKATAPLKRPRYYQSQMDRRLLAKGCSYHELPDTFIIFVCDFDYFGAGLAVYERESRIKGTGIAYEDGSHVYILNSRYEEGNCDRAILESLDYIRTDNAHLEYHSELAQKIVNRVDAVRQDEEMEGVYMSTELYEMELREKGLKEGKETTLLANIKSLVETMQISVEQAMNALRVPPEDRARLRAQL